MFSRLELLNAAVARVLSHPLVPLLSLVILAGWLASGPWLGYSSLWQDILNTSTAAVNFVLLFVLLNVGARSGAAAQLKADELIRSTDAARNEVIAAESKTSDEIEELAVRCDICK